MCSCGRHGVCKFSKKSAENPASLDEGFCTTKFIPKFKKTKTTVISNKQLEVGVITGNLIIEQYL